MRHGLGSEHPLCDKIQLLMLVLFFAFWVADTAGYFIFGFSTVVLHVLGFPALSAIAIPLLCLSFVLVFKSHKAVFEQARDSPALVDSGAYAWVRHPMYLGTLLLCLSFLFISFSFVSTGIWMAFFIFYDRMATYEEKSLVEILGEEYIAYQKRVSKWLPKLC